MTTGSPNGRARFRFSLWHILALTAIIAVWTAVLLAFETNARLTQRRNDLLALSSRLEIADPDRLQCVAYPPVAKDLKSWEVHVPERKAFELRFCVATVSKAGMPQDFEKIPLTAGRHRITLHSADHPDEGFRFRVFVDGQTVIARSMGREWMPNGWQRASGLNPPFIMRGGATSMLHLSGKSYTPRTKFESGSYFNGQSDEWVSHLGYRLWIDRADQTYPPPSPFVGFEHLQSYDGMGLRDGLRYRTRQSQQYAWTFIRPASESRKPVLTIVPEFFVGNQKVLGDQTIEFAGWKRIDVPREQKAGSTQADPGESAYSILLQADVESASAAKPVVELRWDASRPKDVGIRLPKTPPNADLTKWRMRIIDGTSHLWRLLDAGEQTRDVRTSFRDTGDQPLSHPLPLPLDPQSDGSYRISWRTDIAKPLQMLERDKENANAYRSLSLFRGLPVAFEAEIAASQEPRLKIVRVLQHSGEPNAARKPIPGGPVIKELQIELDATAAEYVWFRAFPR
ncbi:hypothetical protein [Roseimaritima sediminicola]|uniref:hypothetical protein n=1 Tax=Roseimaritima sediminicola TaxID=2662066 RepID=UPI0012982C9B|nr:hypothetical protein [Roseimaritima sediminicola]